MAQDSNKKQDKPAERAESPENPEAKGEYREAAASVLRTGDRVAAVSYNKDGEPDQSRDFKVKGEAKDQG